MSIQAWLVDRIGRGQHPQRLELQPWAVQPFVGCTPPTELGRTATGLAGPHEPVDP